MKWPVSRPFFVKTPLAICYLLRDGDEANRCLLFHDELQVIKNGRPHIYSLQDRLGLEFTRKKWMLPLVGGAIVLCLSLLFIFRSIFDPWFSLVLLVASFFAIYTGWEGSIVLQVKSGKLIHTFPVRKVSDNLKRFANFLHGYQLARNGQKEQLLIYHITSNDAWVKQQDNLDYTHPSLEDEGFIHCSHHDQVMRSYLKYFREGQALVLIGIFPLDLKNPLQLESAIPGADLFPHIYGPINREAIVSAQHFECKSELKALLKRT